MKLKATISPLRRALLAGHDNALDLLIQVQGPPMPAGPRERKPLNLALVIDRSGSMQGRPLEEAKRCAQYVVNSLTERDTVSVVTYDDKALTVVPFTRVVDRNAICRQIEAIHTDGMTALFDGWQWGVDQAMRGVTPDALSRVLLLSDGQANVGLQDPVVISAHVARAAAAGVSTSTYGLGNHFNEDLMSEMARAGQGNAYYGETLDDLMEPFEEEFSLLSATYASDVRLTLHSAPSCTVKVRNRYQRDDLGRTILPALPYDGTVWAMLRVTVPAELVGMPRDEVQRVLEATLTLSSDGESQHVEIAPLALPVMSQAAFGAVAENETVRVRLRELDAAALHDEAREAARRHDWHRVDALLQRARREFHDHEWVANIVRELEGLANRRDVEGVSKLAMYAANRMHNRVTEFDEAGLNYCQAVEEQKPLHMQKKRHHGRSGQRQ